MRTRGAVLLVLVLLAALAGGARGSGPQADPGAVPGEFLLLLLGSDSGRQDALSWVDQHWQPGFAPMLLEVISLSRDPGFSGQMLALLERRTGQALGYDLHGWFVWLWNQPAVQHRDYAEFKSAVYGLIDPAFEGYFGRDRPATIRLDEVQWGGVAQDGIPPLHRPDMVAADRADYLADSDIVFGLSVNGDARAYPRRILGWHELFTDVVGGEPVAGVYCTLCGTMILYHTRQGEVTHLLGTSGFLYRSNKLMYDQATQSLWNTLWGEPVVGPLAGQGIRLQRGAVVTTTWGEWRRRHPDTRVLSLATGHPRDYRESAAYRDYYATDELMFQVPALDGRLDNKAEVLGLVLPEHPQQPLALSADFLHRHPLYHDRVGALELVVLTDNSGANRAYHSEDVRFVHWDGDVTLVDRDGAQWRLTEATLVRADGRELYRLPAQRAFWFGWFSAYSHSRLVH